MGKQEDCIPNGTPVQIATKILSEARELFGCDLPELRYLDHVNLQIELAPGVKTIRPTPDRVFHSFTDRGARGLYFAAKIFPDAYEAMKEVCKRNLQNNEPLPWLLNQFIIQELDGKFDRVKRKGPPPSKDFALKWFMYDTTLYISDAFNIDISRNEASPEWSAVDAVVDAAEGLGCSVKYTTLRDWCQHADSAAFRERADRLTNFLKDEFLRSIGQKAAIEP